MSAPAAPPPDTTGFIEVGEASEAFLEVVNANGVDTMFVMPGDIYPVLEAMAKFQATGKRLPRIVTTPHETVGLAAAHGHFLVSGKPQVCLFHVDVGVQHAGGMLHNAQRARAGVVICSGRTPMTFEGEMRGGRVIDVHWMQDRRDQPSVVRDYVKWYYELARPENMNHVLQRAFQIAGSDPAGPVYVSLLRELLLEKMDKFRLLPPERFGPVRPPAPDAAALERLADQLLDAEHPVIITGHAGRSAAGFEALSALAHAAAIPVVSRPERANIASAHKMAVGADPGAFLAQADVILTLDCDVPWTPLFHRLRKDARIVQIDIDPLKLDLPVWGFPVDEAIQASTAVALPALRALIEDRLTEARKKKIAGRRAQLEAAHGARQKKLAEAAEAQPSTGPITVPFLCREVAALVDEGTIVVDDSTTARGVAADYMPMRAGSYFQPTGSSMGWGSGAAIGVKLAAQDKTVINLNADGNFISGAPEAALWTAAQQKAPFLTVIYNNRQYAAIKFGLLHEYPQGYAARTRNFPTLDLPAPPDFAQIARACGAYGARVEAPGEVREALQRGLQAVRDGQSAVLDVQVAGP